MLPRNTPLTPSGADMFKGEAMDTPTETTTFQVETGEFQFPIGVAQQLHESYKGLDLITPRIQAAKSRYHKIKARLAQLEEEVRKLDGEAEECDKSLKVLTAEESQLYEKVASLLQQLNDFEKRLNTDSNVAEVASETATFKPGILDFNGGNQVFRSLRSAGK